MRGGKRKQDGGGGEGRGGERDIPLACPGLGKGRNRKASEINTN